MPCIYKHIPNWRKLFQYQREAKFIITYGIPQNTVTPNTKMQQVESAPALAQPAGLSPSDRQAASSVGSVPQSLSTTCSSARNRASET